MHVYFHAKFELFTKSGSKSRCGVKIRPPGTEFDLDPPGIGLKMSRVNNEKSFSICHINSEICLQVEFQVSVMNIKAPILGSY